MSRGDQGASRSSERYQAIPRTLAFISYGAEVLLLRGGPHKKLWAGLYNGVGGHVERGEDILTAARREIREETGLETTDVRLAGMLHINAGAPDPGILVFVFRASAVTRETVPSDEGELVWLPDHQIPTDGVVEDLPALLPRVLAMGPGDPPFYAAYEYDANDRLVISFAAQP